MLLLKTFLHFVQLQLCWLMLAVLSMVIDFFLHCVLEAMSCFLSKFEGSTILGKTLILGTPFNRLKNVLLARQRSDVLTKRASAIFG